MTAGRRPLPPQFHVLNGNPSKKTQADLDAQIAREKFFSDEMPEPPQLIVEDPDCMMEWNNIVPQLQKAKVIKTIDFSSLVQYCVAYGEWMKAQRAIRKARLVRTKSGELTLNPMFKVSREMSQTMQRFLSEFGMTPSSRVRVPSGGSGPAKDEVEEEFFG